MLSDEELAQSDGAKGFPREDWSPTLDENEQIPGLEQPTKPKEKPKPMNPVAFADLAKYEDKQVVPCIEGKVASLYEVERINKTTKAPLPYPKQNAVLKDDNGLEHRVAFAEECAIPMEWKGARIRVTCNVGNHGMTGMKMDRYNKNGKYHFVSVTKSAKIEKVGASGQPAASTASPAAADCVQSTEYVAQPATASYQEQGEYICGDTVEERVAQWFDAFHLVCDGAGHDTKTEMEALSHSDLKEITTGILMSFKGKYGMHRPPIFARNVPAQDEAPGKPEPQTEDRSGAQAGDKASPKPTSSGEKVVGWKDYLKDGVRLEDYDESKKAYFVNWAFTKGKDATSEAAKALYPMVIMMDAELRAGALKKIAVALGKEGMSDTFTEDEADELCTEKWGAKLEELNYHGLYELGTNLKEHVAAMKQAFAAKQKPSKPVKAMPRVTEEDDMPD